MPSGSWRTASELRISDTERRTLVVPRWQRAQCWTPEQQAAFCRSIWEGRILHSHVLLWERRLDPQPDMAVRYATTIVDGQQRLSSLGLPVHRNDGTLNACSAFLDIDDGQWYTERAPHRFTVVELGDWHLGRRLYHDDPRRHLWMVMAHDRMHDLRILVSTIEADVPKSTVQTWFRTMAIPGVVLTPEEAERLIAAAEEGL